jgi:2-C-methyl-D-erythritol 4-phosphate cytidylyltransferase
VVVAGGKGSRFGAPKQFARLAGRSLLAWSLDAARAVADGVVAVVPAEANAEVLGDALDELSATPGADPVAVVVGGPTRAASVRAGLAAVPADAEVVVVHDGARPLASSMLFRSVVDAVVQHGWDAAVPALPVSDTLKHVVDGVVGATQDRSGLVAVQTPQAFRASLLRQAHASGGEATDDAALVEACGATVRVVQGDPRNLKVTTRADLEILALLARPCP